MKFVFLGSGAIAQQCLARYQRDHLETAVLVGIAAPQEILDSVGQALGGEAFSKAIELSSTDRKEGPLLDLLRTVEPDFIISIQYPWILSGEILSAAGHRVLNLHNAKLPDYRGHNTISHEILNGETVHVCSLHWMAEEVDRGILARSVNVPIEPGDTAYSLWKRTVAASVDLFSAFMRDCQEIVGTKAGAPVPRGGKYYRKNGIEALKEIPRGATVEDLDRIGRAFWFPPHEPAYIRHEGRKMYVLPNSFNYGVGS